MRVVKPYLAIIVDSFHSALASRVLWAAMLAIWLLLGSLAPIGLREDYTTKFRWFDVYNGTRMKALLAQGMVDPESKNAAVGRIAAAMPDEMQRKLQRVGEGDEVRIRLSLLTDALNDLVDSDAARNDGEETNADNIDRKNEADSKNGADSDKETNTEGWYDAEAWKPTVRLRELRELDESTTNDLEMSLRERRARLRIEAALPGVFEARGARSVLLTYAGLDFPTDFQIDRAQFETIFNQFVIPILVNWLLGLVLVFLGVLVTASIVPDMLQTGSLHLLLSKPVSRWALIVSKFIGGCAFVLLCVTQLVIGLYLIAALRLGVWNARILWCLPVALLIFAVFYSVSVLAGLKWRSAIISIAAAGALAAVCVVVGIIGGVIDARVVQPDRIASMTMAGDELFAVTGGSGLVRLNEDSGQWDSIIDSEAMSNDRILSPVALDKDRLLTARIRNGRFNPFGSGSLDLIVLARDEEWKPQPTLRLPTATERLILIDENRIAAVNTADILVTTRDKVMESLGQSNSDSTLPDESIENSADENSAIENSADEDNATEAADGEQTKPKAKRERQPKASSVGSWLRALVTMQGGATEDFTSILPSQVSLSPPARLATIENEQAFIVLTADRLYRLEPSPREEDAARSAEPIEPVEPQPWIVSAKTEVPKGDEMAGPVLAATSRYVLVARGKQPLKIMDATTFDELGQWSDDDRQALIDGTPIGLIPISESQFIYRTTSGHADIIKLVDASSGSVSVRHGGRIDCTEIESLNWRRLPEQPTGTLNVAHHVDRVSRFTIDESGDWRLINTTAPRRSVWRWVDYYLIGALEWLTPQVLQLGDTTAAMVSGNQSIVIGGNDWGDQEIIRYQITRPLLSCLLFIFVVMGIACWYFSRTDF